MLDQVKQVKVGVIPCNGEEICEGTLTRFACRKVLDLLRPHDTVTICLPLFISGDKGEQDFAKTFPTISIVVCLDASIPPAFWAWFSITSNTGRSWLNV